jgi:hemoglobin
MSTASLYERLGRAEGIRRIVDDVIASHRANPLIKARFAGIKEWDRLQRVLVEFFCAGAGGPEAYTGRDLAVAHSGMNLSEQELVAAIDDIVAAMDKQGIDAQTKSDVVGIVYSLKPQVLRL